MPPAAGCLFACAILACARAPSSGPVPLEVRPAQGTPDAPVEVEIFGRGFDPAVHTDYAHPDESTLDTSYEASILPAGGGGSAVSLKKVVLTPRKTITALVPGPPGDPQLAPGSYDLVVVDPSGRKGRLLDAYRVVTAAQSVVEFRVSAIADQVAGIPFLVAVSAVDVAGRTVDQFTGSVSVADASPSAISPAALGPFVNGRARGYFTIAAIRQKDSITVSDGQRAGTSNQFDVGAGPPAYVDFVAFPSTLTQGACSHLTIEVRDVLGSPAPVQAQLPFRLDVAPPESAAAFSNAACTTQATSLAVSAGSSQAGFYLKPALLGSIGVRAVPDTLPSTERRPVGVVAP